MTLAILAAIAAAVVILACAVYLLYKRDMNAARARLTAAERHAISTQWGTVERQFVMWALRKIAPMTMTRLVAAVPKRYVMSADETSFANEFIDSLFPMFPAGANFDLFVSNADVTQYDLESVRVPTLIAHTVDDQLASHDASRRAAARIPGARFLSLESGGHLMLGLQKSSRFGELDAFLSEKDERKTTRVAV